MAALRGCDSLEERLTLGDLNALSDEDARNAFTSCCGSTRWVTLMVNARPFDSIDEMIEAADDAWAKTGPTDWLEAFSHHPRIGERGSGREAAEQAGAQSAPLTVKEQISDINNAYEKKFGHIYIVCAAGKSGEEMLEIAKARMRNEPQDELEVAAEEQRKITEIRLRKLLT
jgi:2-oxo-4-hydroxy-4-carboxy-5-ureidoimidazoline decarboxylase